VRLDNLVMLAVLIVAIAWAVEFLGCSIGVRIPALAWTFATLQPLTMTIVLFAIIIGLFASVFGRAGLPYFVLAGVVLILPSVVEVYAPTIACPV
jgi:hypothetical protein